MKTKKRYRYEYEYEYEYEYVEGWNEEEETLLTTLIDNPILFAVCLGILNTVDLSVGSTQTDEQISRKLHIHYISK